MIAKRRWGNDKNFICLFGKYLPFTDGRRLAEKTNSIRRKEAEFFVDSAATSTYEVGKTPHPGTKKILNQEKVDMTNMVARQITPHDFETFDWIIGMDQENVEELKRRAPRSAQGKIHLFLSSIPGKRKRKCSRPILYQ